MAFKDLNENEIDQLLSRERVMRIGLQADGKLFVVPDMPEWMQSEYAEKNERGEVVIVRVRPSRITGSKSEPA